MAISDEKYVAVTTFRRTGVGVSTATWIVPLESGRLGFWTSSASGKCKRLRNSPKVTVQPADSRGRPMPGSARTDGIAEIVTTGAEFDEIQRKVRAKYGAMVGISKFFNTLGHLGRGPHPYGDVGIVITPGSPEPEPEPEPEPVTGEADRGD